MNDQYLSNLPTQTNNHDSLSAGPRQPSSTGSAAPGGAAGRAAVSRETSKKKKNKKAQSAEGTRGAYSADQHQSMHQRSHGDLRGAPVAASVVSLGAAAAAMRHSLEPDPNSRKGSGSDANTPLGWSQGGHPQRTASQARAGPKDKTGESLKPHQHYLDIETVHEPYFPPSSTRDTPHRSGDRQTDVETIHKPYHNPVTSSSDLELHPHQHYMDVETIHEPYLGTKASADPTQRSGPEKSSPSSDLKLNPHQHYKDIETIHEPYTATPSTKEQLQPHDHYLDIETIHEPYRGPEPNLVPGPLEGTYVVDSGPSATSAMSPGGQPKGKQSGEAEPRRKTTWYGVSVPVNENKKPRNSNRPKVMSVGSGYNERKNTLKLAASTPPAQTPSQKSGASSTANSPMIQSVQPRHPDQLAGMTERTFSPSQDRPVHPQETQRPRMNKSGSTASASSSSHYPMHSFSPSQDRPVHPRETYQPNAAGGSTASTASASPRTHYQMKSFSPSQDRPVHPQENYKPDKSTSAASSTPKGHYLTLSRQFSSNTSSSPKKPMFIPSNLSRSHLPPVSSRPPVAKARGSLLTPNNTQPQAQPSLGGPVPRTLKAAPSRSQTSQSSDPNNREAGPSRTQSVKVPTNNQASAAALTAAAATAAAAGTVAAATSRSDTSGAPTTAPMT
ncbi:hypothetical protein BGW38_007290, partial [Lunasporangiospora selenospora]